MITVDGALFTAAAEAMAAVVESAKGSTALRSGDKLRDEMRLHMMSVLVVAFDDQIYMRGTASEPVPIEAPMAEAKPVVAEPEAPPEPSAPPTATEAMSPAAEPTPTQPEPLPPAATEPNKVDMAAGQTGVPGAAGNQAIERERFKHHLVGQPSISNKVVISGRISPSELTEAGYHFISDRQEWVRA